MSIGNTELTQNASEEVIELWNRMHSLRYDLIAGRHHFTDDEIHERFVKIGEDYARYKYRASCRYGALGEDRDWPAYDYYTPMQHQYRQLLRLVHKLN